MLVVVIEGMRYKGDVYYRSHIYDGQILVDKGRKDRGLVSGLVQSRDWGKLGTTEVSLQLQSIVGVFIFMTANLHGVIIAKRG